MHPVFSHMESIARHQGVGERFRWILSEIARISGKGVDELHPDDEFIALCPQPRWSMLNDKLEELEGLVLKESKGLDKPGDIRTLGRLMTWLVHL